MTRLQSGQQRLSWKRVRISPEQQYGSRSFFDASVSVLKRNQFGFAVGGPAIKNRLFGYGLSRHAAEQGSSSSLSVLPGKSVAQRNGRFDPDDLGAPSTVPTGRRCFPGG